MARAAEPLLASAIWSSLLGTDGDGVTHHTKLATGLHDLDAALNGGLEYGGTTCITAASDSDAQHIVFDLIAAQLISDESASVTVIHSTLSFNVKALHARFTSACATRTSAPEVVPKALSMLDRVRVMKVFDFVGLTESMAELRDDLAHEDGGLAMGDPLQQQTTTSGPPGTIKDSQAEDEDDMLDDAPTSVGEPILPSMQGPAHSTDLGHQTTRLLIIDNIADIASPLLKNNHSQGQALLTSFMRSLQHLTREHKLCTILLNNALSYEQSNREEAPSVFSSCALRPALGKAFTYLLDVHLLMHRVPKSIFDAKALNGEQHTGRAVEMVTVVEVLQDRLSKRSGRWVVIGAKR